MVPREGSLFGYTPQPLNQVSLLLQSWGAPECASGTILFDFGNLVTGHFGVLVLAHGPSPQNNKSNLINAILCVGCFGRLKSYQIPF